MKKLVLLLISSYFFLMALPANAANIHVIAAENVYGSVAQEIGGHFVDVTNILNNPNQDPHLFTLSPNTIKQTAMADIIIYNGAGYDPWMKPLLSATALDTTKIINVAELVGVARDSNPHVWYIPSTMPLVAKKIAALLSEIDPQHQIYYVNNLSQFNRNYLFIYSTIKYFNARYHGTPITATEPIFNDMASSLGLKMVGLSFQDAMMNDVTPSIADIAAFEDSLRHHTVKLLIYNKQVNNPLTTRMLELAKQQHVPVVGVTETLPSGKTYTLWMMEQLNKVDQALLGHGE